MRPWALEINNLLSLGVTIPEIAAEFDCSRIVIKRWLDGVTEPPLAIQELMRPYLYALIARE